MIEKASLDFYREHLEGDFLKIYRPYLRGIKPETEYQQETRELIQNFAQDLIQARKMKGQWQMRYMQLGEVMYRPAEEEEVRDILAMAEALYTPLEVLEQMPDTIVKPESSLADTADGAVESLFITDKDNFFAERNDFSGKEECLNKPGESENVSDKHGSGKQSKTVFNTALDNGTVFHAEQNNGTEFHAEQDNGTVFHVVQDNGVEIRLSVIGEPAKKEPVWGFGGYTEYPCQGYVTGYMKEESRSITVQRYEDSGEICLMWEPREEDRPVREVFWKEYSDWNSDHAEKLEAGFREKIDLLQKAVDARTFVKKV